MVKKYVAVEVLFTEDGRLVPRSLQLGERVLLISRVEGVRLIKTGETSWRGESLPAGEAGAEEALYDEFTVQIRGQQKHLYLERFPEAEGNLGGRWFILQEESSSRGEEGPH